MPKYLYRCDLCGHELELIHPMITPQGVLPLCCSTGMDRVPNAPAIVIKGTGWGKSK